MNWKEVTFKDWEAFIILNYPSYSQDKTIIRMLRELYDIFYLQNDAVETEGLLPELKEALFVLMESNMKLGEAEYKRNLSYNSEHYHYKAEMKIIKILEKYYPKLLLEFTDRQPDT